MSPQSPRRRALSFTRVSLSNWRNFVEVDVPLQRRVFIVGPNASGKSNLLDAFRFLRDLASSGGGLQQAVGSRGGVSRIRCLAARRYSSVQLDLTVTDADAMVIGEHGDEWRYLLRFKQDNQQTPLVEAEQVWRSGKQILSRPDSDDERDPVRLRQTHIEQINANVGFRALAEFFASVSYLHVVPQLIRAPRPVPPREGEYDPYGSDLIERIASVPKRTREAWLRRITDALKLAVPQLSELDLERDDRGVPHLRGKYAHWRAHGAWQGEDDFSDGTLRLIGLLWSLLETGGPLLLEEPEISLHTGVIEHVPEMLYRMQQRTGRQAILSTHSADILRNEGIGLDEVLVLRPSLDGTTVRRADGLQGVRRLLQSGIPLGEAVMPETRPEHLEQLSLFGR